MAKDWKGNSASTFKQLGASNHCEHERAEDDFYATEPKAIDFLLEKVQFEGAIWENACGQGHLSERLIELGHSVISTDLRDRGYGKGGVDFFECTETLAPNIVTNPPYAYAIEWCWKCLELLPVGGKLALFLPIQFLEAQERRELFDKEPPKCVYVFTNRILCGINGDFYEHNEDGSIKLKRDGTPKRKSSAKAYAWFYWEKGYRGDVKLDWIN